MSAFTRVADVVQKGAVLGLFSVFGWQVYQIGQQCTEYAQDKRLERNQHAEIMKKINEKGTRRILPAVQCRQNTR